MAQGGEFQSKFSPFHDSRTTTKHYQFVSRPLQVWNFLKLEGVEGGRFRATNEGGRGGGVAIAMRLHGDRSDREASAPTRVTGTLFKKDPENIHLRGTFTPSRVIVAFPRKKMLSLTFRPEFLGIVARLRPTE